MSCISSFPTAPRIHVALLLILGCGSADPETDERETSTNENSDAGREDSAGDSGVPNTDPDASDTGGTASDTGPESDTSWPSGKYLTLREVHERVVSGDPEMVLINVSDEIFYYLGHIEGSLKIPWNTLEDNLDAVAPERHIVLYCRLSVRSEAAYDTLTAASYSKVWVMADGLEAWIAAGYPTVP